MGREKVNHSIASLFNVPLLTLQMEQTGPSASLLDLTAGLARGDDASWSEFHRSHGPGIFRHLLAATHGDHDLATEALQQTYLRIARYARPCDSATMFTSWVRTVTRTALHDCRRRRLSFWNLLQRRHGDPSDDLASAQDDERTLAALDTALAQLAPENRSLLEAKYFSGLAVQTIAKNLALSPKAAESRLTRARAELRRHLIAALPRHD